MAKKAESKYQAVMPGNYLEEVLKNLGMGKDELARRMGRPAAKLSHIFSGKKAVTPETALQLEKVTGVKAQVWTDIESEYRLALAHIKEEKALSKTKITSKTLSSYCYKELSELGLLQQAISRTEKLAVLLGFFGVTSLKHLKNIKRYRSFYHKTIKAGKPVSPEALTAWLRIGENLSINKDCIPFNARKLMAAIPEIRKMTRLPYPECSTMLLALLANCGIALVEVPFIQKAGAAGASFWLSKDKAVIMLLQREYNVYNFWFSIFHAIAHLTHHGKLKVFIEYSDMTLQKDDYEKEADKAAAEWLIPLKEYKRFLFESTYTREEILEFAEKIEIHPEILSVRLLRDKIQINS